VKDFFELREAFSNKQIEKKVTMTGKPKRTNFGRTMTAFFDNLTKVEDPKSQKFREVFRTAKLVAKGRFENIDSPASYRLMWSQSYGVYYILFDRERVPSVKSINDRIQKQDLDTFTQQYEYAISSKLKKKLHGGNKVATKGKGDESEEKELPFDMQGWAEDFGMELLDPQDMTEVGRQMMNDLKDTERSQFGEDPKESHLKSVTIDLINQGWDEANHLYEFESKNAPKEWKKKDVYLYDRASGVEFAYDLSLPFGEDQYIAFIVPSRMEEIKTWGQLKQLKWATTNEKITRKHLKVLEEWFGKGGGAGN
jgi:hypothetical protein